MADPVWPAALPQTPLRDGYSEEPQNNVLETPTDAGPGESRRRYTAVAVKNGYSFRMTQPQTMTFETFWRQQIFDGSIPFVMMHSRKGADARFRSIAPYKIVPWPEGGNTYLVNLFLKELP